MHKLPDDPRFRNVSYRDTNLERTFERIRRQMKAEKAAREAAEMKAQEAAEAARIETERKISPIKGRA